jgi:hypothetical protein
VAKYALKHPSRQPCQGWGLKKRRRREEKGAQMGKCGRVGGRGGGASLSLSLSQSSHWKQASTAALLSVPSCLWRT